MLPTVEVIYLEPVGVLRGILHWNFCDFSIGAAHECWGLLGDLIDNLGVLFGQPAEEGGDTLGSARRLHTTYHDVR